MRARRRLSHILVGLAVPALAARAAGARSPQGASAAGSGGGGPPAGPTVTFSRDIAPIVFEHCAPCHHSGGAGPFSLLTYGDVAMRARLVAHVTKSRYMPPWLPEPGYGSFSGVRRLDDAQIETIQRWAAQGAPEGDRARMPAAPRFRDGWQLGRPDLVLEMPRPYELRAGGPDVFRNFVLPVPVSSRRYVKAVEVLPSNRRVVHHANILIDRGGSARRLDAADPEVGFGGMGVRLESNRFEPQGHFLFWKPGTVPIADPDEMSWPLDKGTDLVMSMHLKPTGKPELVRATIGLYFCDRPPSRFPLLLQLEHDGALDIPPGQREFAVSDELELPLDVDLLGLYPHAHYLGKEMQAFATLPTGEKIWLIWIKHWDINWQGVFRYDHPIHLPRGTRLSMRWTYDNSDANEVNPNHPAKRVRAGNESSDEMSHLWVQVLPRLPEERKVLQEALMRQKLRKYPGEFYATLNLATVLQSMGRLPEAIAQYRQAVAAKPGDAIAENNLGAAILSTGVSPANLDEAVAHFRGSLRARPDYADAHYNLGSALFAQGKLEEAALHFERILADRPNDADAHDRLGSIYVVRGEVDRATPHFEAAILADPRHASALKNLGYVQASKGNLAGAALNLERSLEVRPDDPGAHNLLGSIYERQGRPGEAVRQFEQAVRLDPGDAEARQNLARARSSGAPPR